MVSSFTFADLCAGIGGFRIGLESLGGSCVFSSDINENCEKTYFANHNARYDEYDIFDINESNFPSVDILCGGFPCQPFSIAGKKIGFNDERGTVFFKIASIAKVAKPKIIFLENVTNLVKIDKGNTLKTIFNELEDIGYNVHYEILDSSDFGVPQSRKRVYIVAIDASIQSFGFQFTKKRIFQFQFLQNGKLILTFIRVKYPKKKSLLIFQKPENL